MTAISPSRLNHHLALWLDQYFKGLTDGKEFSYPICLGGQIGEVDYRSLCLAVFTKNQPAVLLIYRILLDGRVDSGLLRFGLVPLEGRLAIVTDAGRDAMDAVSTQDERTGSDGEVVWSWHPVPVSTVANRLGTPGRARRKP
jgi:hypothetical protein